MSTKLGVVLADFTTQLASVMAVGATSATLQSATDDDGVALPAGVYFFAIDGNNSQKEHIVCTLSGTSLTGISSVNRQGVQASGCVRTHRVGSTVTLTDFAHLRYINDLVSGASTFNASVPLGYDGTASITTANQFATKAYVDGVAVSGAPTADTTTKGIVEEATLAEVLAKTVTGSTGARLYVNPVNMASTLLSDYKADTGAADVLVITPAPAITAYTAGQRFSFKVAATNLTTTPTLNVNALGAKTIVKMGGSALAAGDLLIGQVMEVEYDGTNMQLMTPVANLVLPAQASKAGFFLTTNATTPSWARVNPLVYVSPTQVTVASTTSETTIYTTSIPANILGAGNALKIEIPISDIASATSGKTHTLRLKYGGTTLATIIMTMNSTMTNASITAYIIASGATNSQKGIIAFNAIGNGTEATNNNTAGNMGTGTSAVDSTAAQTFVITDQPNENAAGTLLVAEACIITLVI